MTQIILDAEVSSKLTAATHPVERCDPSGKVLGRFVPKFTESEWEWVLPEISEEELDRRSKSNEKRYTTAEVLAYLEQLQGSVSKGSEQRSDFLEVPWHADQVMSLNAYQACSWHHPFTCGERDPDGTHHALVATSEGWYCPNCRAMGKEYVQTWCHTFMADWSWNHEPL